MEGVVLIGANLESVGARRTTLQEANLQKANPRRSSFKSADLSREVLIEAAMDEASFIAGCFWGINLYRAALRKTPLVGAELVDASLIEAGPEEAGCTMGDSSPAEIRNGRFQGTSMRGAVLTYLRDHTKEQLTQARGLEWFRLPKHLKRG